jgi:hypothetical protein
MADELLVGFYVAKLKLRTAELNKTHSDNLDSLQKASKAAQLQEEKSHIRPDF